MPSATNPPFSNITSQSPPLDTDQTGPTDTSTLSGKTILITGGASGFGKGMFTRWASCDATVIIGDIDTTGGSALVESVRASSGNPNLHFVHLDVASWPSQVAFFRKAVDLSPTGSIDTVVANAGVDGAAESMAFENPGPRSLDLSDPDRVPPAPSTRVLDINLTGVLYTTHLALYYLPLNPSSPARPPPADADMESLRYHRDRHILLIGSVASLFPISGGSLYGVSKHAVLGLFRCLRGSVAATSGVRVNLVCPYFIDTPILGVGARIVTAGIPLGKVDDVVEACTRFVADPRIVGRSLAIGPRVKADWDFPLQGKPPGGGDEPGKDVDYTAGGGKVEEKAIWEIYAHDFDTADAYTKNILRVVNAAATARGWVGIIGDIVSALTYPARRLWRR